MIERHYEDEALISLLESDRAGADLHLPSCPPCSDKLASFRTISGLLQEADVWDARELRTDPVPSTVALLRRFADRMADENTRAEAILPELLAGPRETWMPRLHEHPEWRTAGVVRKLLEAEAKAIDSMPPDAVEMTALAIEIAEHLEDGEGVHQLRGIAWRERGYVLFYVGRYAEGLAATERADAALRHCMVDEYDRARVGIVRAIILRAMEEEGTAITAARQSAEAFGRFEDRSRYVSARLAEVQLLFNANAYAEAERILHDLDRRMTGSHDLDTHARVLGNLGHCYWKLGHIEEAIPYLDASAALHDSVGTRTESVRTRWTVGLILAGAGRIDEALERLVDIHAEFTRLGMTSAATLVDLDIAELRLVRSEFSAVEQICRTAIRAFEVAGLSYTAQARTALAYMHEAARLRTATPALARHVKEYIRELPRNENLLFAPPPF